MKKCLLSLVVLPCVAVANELPVFVKTPPPVLFDDVNLPAVPAWTDDDKSSSLTLARLSTEEVQSHLFDTEDLIAKAMAEEDWAILKGLLDVYQAMPSFDGILVDYATGAMLRKQGDQQGAIAKYKSILAHRPELSYVKLDLALMLFEDRQTKEAKKVFDELEQDLKTPDAVLAVIKDFKEALKQQTRFKPNIALNYESTNNVNNASSETKITWLGKEWQKADDSLPQSAQGIRYGLGLSKTHNLTGNHNVVAEGDVSGVSYWDNKPFNETSVRLSAGYAYADINKNGRIMPFFEQNWLGKEKYNQNIGVSLGYGQPLSPKLRMQFGATLVQKRYDDDRLAKRYDGKTLSLSSTLSRGLSGGVSLYGGFDGTLDKTKDRELASVRYGVRAGVAQEFDNGLGVNASVRYGKRTFDAPSTLVYDFVRKDDEYQASLALWHKNIAWRGLRPKANVRYVKIDSNMPAFYSRDGVSYFMSVEKMF